jgi:hypothetical protein
VAELGGPFEWPDPGSLPEKPERLILHWTAGAHISRPDEWLHYHILIDHEENVAEDADDDTVTVLGGVPLERNMRDVRGLPSASTNPDEGYAAHTRGFNSRSIGLALCGMRGAIDRRPSSQHPGMIDPGPSPITRLQVRRMVMLCVDFCQMFGYQPLEDRIFTHWEAQEIHGVRQKGKWDITWLPGHLFTRRDCGPFLRRQTLNWLEGKTVDV